MARVKRLRRDSPSARVTRTLLITPDRLAYYGPFGQPSSRCLGAWTLYVSPDRPFALHEQGRPPRSTPFALVRPWVTHRVIAHDRELAVILIEADSIDPDAMLATLAGSAAAEHRSARHIMRGFANQPARVDNFDTHFFGAFLPPRWIDHRVRRAIDLIAAPETAHLSVEECARRVSLSPSRFMHLFNEQTCTTFRRFRAWKRARRFLGMLTGNPKLVEIALEAGYADSTHLSRCVRNCYGYTPSVMCEASRSVTVVAQI